MVCFVKLKELADEIHDWNDCHQRGIQKWDFTGIFGNTYLRVFTPELIKLAWKAVEIYSYNPEIIPLNKPVSSETLITWFTTANAIHSTPVQKIMSVFSYFNMSLEQDKSDDNNNTNDPFLPSFTPRSHVLLGSNNPNTIPAPTRLRAFIPCSVSCRLYVSGLSRFLYVPLDSMFF